MSIQNLIITFLQFFKQRGYVVQMKNNITHYDNNDILFINSGIAGIFNEFNSSKITKLATIQQCLRIDGKHNDFDNIGTSKSHFCSFKMLGTFSNTDTDVASMIKDIYDFCNNLFQMQGFIYVTVHPEDKVSPSIWRKIDPKIEIRESIENSWSLKNHGPYGYCTEIMYKRGVDDLELWNIVMMDRTVHEDGTYTMYPNIKIDTGGGLERIYSVFKDEIDLYFSDVNFDFVNKLLKYASLENVKIMLDSIKAISSMLESNIVIGNNSHGYVLKKLMRRLITTVMKHKDVNLHLILFYGANHISKISEFAFIYRAEYAALLKCNQLLDRHLANKTILTSEEVIKLHHTYGVHCQYTLEHASSLNISIPNIEDIKDGLYGNNDNIKKEIVPKSYIQNTIFDYDIDSINLDNIEIFDLDFNTINLVNKGDKFIFLISKTCFYPESGGQDYDTGHIIINDAKVAKVTKVLKKGLLIYHYAEALISFNLEDLIQGVGIIDKIRREKLGCGHTMHHILLACVDKILFDNCMQQSSQIKEDKISVTFYTIKKLTKILSASDLENYVNGLLSKGLFDLNIKYIPLQTAIENKYRMLLCGYNDLVRAVDILYNKKLFSHELCGGTHMINNKFRVKVDSIADVNVYNTKIIFKLLT